MLLYEKPKIKSTSQSNVGDVKLTSYHLSRKSGNCLKLDIWKSGERGDNYSTQSVDSVREAMISANTRVRRRGGATTGGD